MIRTARIGLRNTLAVLITVPALASATACSSASSVDTAIAPTESVPTSNSATTSAADPLAEGCVLSLAEVQEVVARELPSATVTMTPYKKCDDFTVEGYSMSTANGSEKITSLTIHVDRYDGDGFTCSSSAGEEHIGGATPTAVVDSVMAARKICTDPEGTPAKRYPDIGLGAATYGSGWSAVVAGRGPYWYTVEFGGEHHRTSDDRYLVPLVKAVAAADQKYFG
ncbi:hypothetical protein [Tsukamurella sp. NPDC003166]|uniref:hypothetical protein n=1 Tax=Tsukamurella sp. NPDC003166 TaxID=3154444 RepID=UPI00339E8950